MPENASACVCCDDRPNELGLIAARPPAAKLKLIVEQQVSGGLAVLHRQGRERLIFE